MPPGAATQGVLEGTASLLASCQLMNKGGKIESCRMLGMVQRYRHVGSVTPLTRLSFNTGPLISEMVSGWIGKAFTVC